MSFMAVVLKSFSTFGSQSHKYYRRACPFPEYPDLTESAENVNSDAGGPTHAGPRAPRTRRREPAAPHARLSYDWRSGQTAVVPHRRLRVHLSRVPRPRPLGRSAHADLYRLLH